jgi:hypothetical protein
MRWSISAHNTFRRCQRQYFFSQIMASHNARDPERHEAFILKQLQSLPAWQGNLVHKGIQKFVVPWLANGSLPDRDDVIRQTLAMADRQIAFSSSCQYRVAGQSKLGAGDSYCALFEHEYGISIAPERLLEVRETVSQCLRNLFDQHDFLEQLRHHSGHRTELLVDFKVADTRVVVQLDLLCFQGERMPVIIDWKVGRSESSDYSHQVMTYALSLLRSPMCANVPVEGISAYEVNLLKNQVKPHIVTEGKIIDTENFIFQSIEEIKAVSTDRTFESQHLEDYELARSWVTCMYCNFRKLCRGLST